MSKRSFNEIEHAIKAAADAHEPAFDEQAWKKMEAMLDKEKDRKRPFVFWLWLLLPLLTGAGLISYFVSNKADKVNPQQEMAVLQNDNGTAENKISTNTDMPEQEKSTIANTDNKNLTVVTENKQKGNFEKRDHDATSGSKKNRPGSSTFNDETNETDLTPRKNINDKVKGKMTADIKVPNLETDNEDNTVIAADINPEAVKSHLQGKIQNEEIIVIKVDADKTTEKEIEKIVDSVAEKISNDKKAKNKIARLYIIAAGGAEANGVKLFSADKITGRYGLGIGYQLNKNFSVQTGFYVSNKKYAAAGSDYKTKPGSYWNIVDLKTIEANCRVYEIPISLVYNFTPGKKVNIFASAGLSSYIIKKEDYHFNYEHYGTPQQASVYYKDNKNLFSVLRISAGIEKKINNRFSIFASPGVSVPLSGVGEGEVKLYSTDIIFGIKFSPFSKK